MIDWLKACVLWLIILIVLLLDNLSYRVNRIFWASSVGWLMGQAMAHLLWYSDYYPWWKRWAYTLELWSLLGPANRGQGLDRHLWLE